MHSDNFCMYIKDVCCFETNYFCRCTTCMLILVFCRVWHIAYFSQQSLVPWDFTRWIQCISVSLNLYFVTLYWSGFYLTVESSLHLVWFCITSLSDWLIKFTPLSQPYRCKINTNDDSLVHIFQHLASATYIFFKFQLVCWIVCAFFDWPD